MHHWYEQREEELMWEMKEKEEAEERRRIEDAKEWELHTKMRSDMVVKYFSDTISPAVHDSAASKEAFAAWKEQFVRVRFLEREDILKAEMKEKEEEEKRRRQEEEKEREVHKKMRSDMVIKYFSDTISPAVHDGAAVKEAFAAWKEDFMHFRFEEREKKLQADIQFHKEEEARRRAEEKQERELHTKTRGDMMIKYFSETVSPQLHDGAAQKEAFLEWKEEFTHWMYLTREEGLRAELQFQKEEEERKRAEERKERELHAKSRSDMVIKYFSETISPAVHDGAALKEVFIEWKEQYAHWNFEKRELKFVQELAQREEEEKRRREEDAKERELHTKMRGDMVVKYFSEAVSPQLHDGAARKEIFAGWKEQFMHVSYEEREKKLREEMKQREEEAAKRRDEEYEKERQMHAKARSDMVVKLFSEKVSPGIHDVAAKKEAFGVWNEQFMHHQFMKREKKLMDGMVRQIKKKGEEDARRNLEAARERRVHAKSRKDMVLKYMSDNVSSALHDGASKKESFGSWKEQFMHVKFEEREEKLRAEMKAREEEEARRREEEEKERQLHMKTRGDMMVKYFSDTISPAVHDSAAKKEAFNSWREMYMHFCFLELEENLKAEMREKEEEEKRRQKEEAKERAVHMKTRSDMVVKYFSDTISPAVHDNAAKKEGFSLWKEQFMHWRFMKQEEKIRAEMEMRREEEARNRREAEKEAELHTKAKGDMVVKYFSETVSPALHDGAAKKETFNQWREQYMHFMYVERERQLKEAMKSRQEEEEKRRNEEFAKERQLHNKARSDMIMKYMSEKVAPGVHDAAARKEAFGDWVEQWTHEQYEKKEKELRNAMMQKIKERMEQEMARQVESAKERDVHSKMRSEMIVKYFSETISPTVYDGAAKKEAFDCWKEQFMHVRFLEREEELRVQQAMKMSEEERKREEDAKEREVHSKMRSEMIVKYFSETVSPAVYDGAAKKEVFDCWKEEFMHVKFLEREEELRAAEARKRAEDAKEREVHSKMRSEMIVKYFSETVSPAVYDGAAKKEGFDCWKEAFMHVAWLKKEANLQKQNHAAKLIREQEFANQRSRIILNFHDHHEKQKSVFLKYFSEKISPSIHDAAALREVWSSWREQYVENEGLLREERLSAELQFRKQQYEDEFSQQSQSYAEELHNQNQSNWQREQEYRKQFSKQHALHNEIRSRVITK
jgi:hypothetical protein